MTPELLCAITGCILVLVCLVLILWRPNPTPFQWYVLKTVLIIAAILVIFGFEMLKIQIKIN